MSVIIVSTVLLIMMALAAEIVFYGRFNILDCENKRISVGLAEACARMAMLEIARNNAYDPSLNYPSGDLVVLENGKSCKICKVVSCGAGCWEIYSRAKHGRESGGVFAFTNLKTQIVSSGGSNVFNTRLWEEISYDASVFGDCLP